MKIFLFLIISSFTLMPVNHVVADNDLSQYCRQRHPDPAKISPWTIDKNNHFGHFYFITQSGLKLKSYFYKPTAYNKNSSITFVMHGADRNAKEYLNTFAPVAEQNNTFVVAPEFSDNYFPTSSSYTLGVGQAKPPKGNIYIKRKWKVESKFLYQEIERIFEAVKSHLGSDACGYYMFGHSAGAQFIHRLNTFLPTARLIRAAAVNAGWYTLPSWGNGHTENYDMPYGLQGTPVKKTDLKKSLSKQIIIMVGEEDIKTPQQSKMVRGTKEAMYQGNNRLQRGLFYYQTAQQTAQKLNQNLAWKFSVIPKANHNKHKVVQSAAWYLYQQNNQEACQSSDASQANNLILTEIHADPAKGVKGDANNDGERDSHADEFVEFYNKGNTEICLTGWTLGDNDRARRHVFPIGSKISPGQYLVVFGGGIPSGLFGQSVVQWASYSNHLNLNNKGDGIKLYHHNGQLLKYISWGDCAGKTCSKNHIPFALDFNQSIVRSLDQSRLKKLGPWVHHTTLSNKLFSPGQAVNDFSGK